MGKLWYVAYGSNILPTNMARYLGSTPENVTSLFRLHHERYFAGESARWDGGVAFLSLYRSLNGCKGRGYLVTEDQFDKLFCGENRVEGLSVAQDVRKLSPGQRAAYDIPEFHTDLVVGKYNAVLRVEDIDGTPAATITTARMLPRRAPDNAYLSTILAGERLP